MFFYSEREFMFVSKKMQVILLVSALALLNGCSSQKDFIRPQAGAFNIGKTTQAEVIQTMGKPRFESKPDFQMNGEEVKSSTYYFTESPGFWGVVIEKHSMTFSFFNDLLAGEIYNSSYSKDKTVFPLDKIPQVKIGMTSAEVIAIMGTPSGKAVYPVIKNKEGSGLVYAYNYARFAGMLTSPNDYLFIVTLNNSGVVTELLYIKDGKEQVIS